MTEKNKKKRKRGQPKKFSDVESMQQKIDAYFASCMEHWEEVTTYIEKRDEKGRPVIQNGSIQYEIVRKMIFKNAVVPTVTGLAVALDCDRETIMNYSKDSEFFGAIKKAKDKIHAAAENKLMNGGGHPLGTIFNLKNNWGWVDQSELRTIDERKKISKEEADRYIEEWDKGDDAADGESN